MNFTLNDDQQAIQSMVRDMTRAGVAPQWSELGPLGLCGITVPESLGGTGMGMVEACLCLEQLATSFPSVAWTLYVHNILCTGTILTAGSEEQKSQWVPGLSSGSTLGSYTTDGRTTPHGCDADLVVVGNLVYEGPLTATPCDVLGFRGVSPADLSLDSGKGVALAGDVRKALDLGRIGLAAVALGIAQGALKHGSVYASERKQFGQPISRFQAIQWQIADSATAVDAARLMTYKAAWRADNGQLFSSEASMARQLAVNAALLATDYAVQIHGGYGYTTEYPVEELYRDARACAVWDQGGDSASDHIAAVALDAL